MKVKYTANNSGGNWRLTDEHWLALEKAGWQVQWARDAEILGLRGERFLGALATNATRVGLSLQEAVDEWEKVTGQSSTEVGCPCCGQPHYFEAHDDNGKYVGSGPDTDYRCSW